jgi:hypothetical protein
VVGPPSSKLKSFVWSHIMTADTPDRPGVAFLVRLFWMFMGPAILFFCATAIGIRKTASLGIVDAMFWLTAAALVLLRHIDIRRFDGQTCEGEPATMSHWRRYAVMLVGFSLLIWLIAHGTVLLP